MSKYRTFFLQIATLSLLLFSREGCGNEPSNTFKKSICLNMIVKNEKDVIERCLTSTLPFINTWIIVDTGSTDGTQKIIEDFFKKNNIPGTLYERSWINFSYNRNEALTLAKDKSDYLLFMDADDVLETSNNFTMPPLTADFYIVLGRAKKEEYWAPRFIKASLDWFWEGIIHENLSCKNKAIGESLFNIEYVYTQEGSRSKDPNTWKKDEELLLKSIQEDPKNPRNYFYIARTYMNEKKLDLALKYFKERITLEGNPEELFASKLFLAKIQSILNLDSNIIKKSFFEAYLCRPHRIEPLYYLTSHLRQEGNYEKGYEIASIALNLPSIPGDYYYLEQWVYEFGLLFEFACCAIHTKHYAESYEACNKLLACSNLPDALRKDASSWAQYIRDLNTEKAKEQLISIMH